MRATPMTKSNAWRYALITIYSFAMVALLHERLMCGQDPGNFLAAIELGINTLKIRPHVPGYPLFVLLWKALKIFGLSTENAIFFSNGIWISIGLSALYKLATKIANVRVATIATLFAALNPLILFYGSTGELYTYDLAFSSVAMLAAISVRREHLKWVWLAFGFAGGFRLSSVVFLYPAMLTAMWLRKEDLHAIITQHAFAVLGTLAWLVPFVMHHGGFGALAAGTEDTAKLRSTVLQSAASYASAAVWMLHLAIPLLVLAVKQFKKLRRDHRIILIVWLVLPTLFFIFRFYAKGYILITLPAFAILLAMAIEEFSDRMRSTIATVIIGGGLALFFCVPLIPPSIPLETSEKMSDRLKTAGYRTISWFATSNAHLRAREEFMAEAKELIERHVPAGERIVTDRAMTLWAHPRTLQYQVPDRQLMMPEGALLTKLYKHDLELGFQPAGEIKDSVYFICPICVIPYQPIVREFAEIERGRAIALYRASAQPLLTLLRQQE